MSKEDGIIPSKRPKLENTHDQSHEDDQRDIYRTGAKCTLGGPQDPCLPGAAYHEVGAFRTKPGRGERTLSMSCSDKMAKWTVMGVQGALLMQILADPLYIGTVIIGGKCPYDETSLRRAIIDRNSGFEGGNAFKAHEPTFLRLEDVQIELGDQQETSMPSHLCSWWHDGLDKSEVLVDGYKQGATLSKRNQESSRSLLCRWALSKAILPLISVTPGIRYLDLKRSAVEKGRRYWDVWNSLRTFYKYWIRDSRKEEAQQFLV